MVDGCLIRGEGIAQISGVRLEGDVVALAAEADPDDLHDVDLNAADVHDDVRVRREHHQVLQRLVSQHARISSERIDGGAVAGLASTDRRTAQ
jgi:hypothetical protein